LPTGYRGTGHKIPAQFFNWRRGLNPAISSVIGTHSRLAGGVVGTPSKPGQVHPRRVTVAGIVLALIGLIGIGYSRAIDWSVERMPGAIGELSLADLVIRAIAIIVVAWAAERLVHELLLIGFIERRVKRHVPQILVGLIAGAIYLIGFFVIATSILRVSASVVLAATGLLLILLGVPFRAVIEDMVAGIVLSFDRSFGIGVIIEIPDGRVGKVQRLGLVGTNLLLPDGSISVVRNSTIGKHGYTVRASLGDDLRQNFTIAFPHHVAPPRAMRLLKGAVLATKGIGEAQDPQVLIDDISAECIVYRLTYGIPNLADGEQIRSNVALTLLRHADQVGLSLSSEQVRAGAFRDKASTWDSVDIPLIVDRLNIFSVLTPEERCILAKNASSRSLPEGAVVCSKGEPGGALFVLVEGVLDVTVVNQDGVRVRLSRVEPGDCVGEMALLTGEPRSADVCARSPALILEIRSEHLSPILQSRPALAQSLAALMVERLRRTKDNAMSAPGAIRPQARTDLVGQIAQRIKSFLSDLRS
jgi:CRP-like cAMP-binding protein/small-conductance mechanosensitive channel